MTPKPLLLPALGLDVRLASDLWLRLDAGYATHVDDAGGISGGLGVVYRPARRPAPAPEPTPVAAGPYLWDGEPVCRWRDTEAAQAALARTGGALADAEEAVASAAAGSTAEAPALAELPEPFEQSTLVVVASPGDVVKVGGVEQAVEEDGVWVSVVAGGEVDLQVVGGGRRWSTDELYLVPGTTWVRADFPQEPPRVRFAVDDATLTDEQAAVVRGLASRTAGWSWLVVGSASPEGDPDHNAALAARRAEVVYAAMLEAGLSAERVTLRADPSFDADATPEDQRAVFLYPQPPGGAP